MKKILLTSLIGLISANVAANAVAQDEIKFAMEATYAPF
ncbi:arginine ABC transporter substrate-binding protein, partial [Vibrio parahaemolyticus]